MVDLLLDCGYEVVVIDNLATGQERNLEHHHGNRRCRTEFIDVCDLPPESSLFRGVDYVFHFAGLGDIVPSIQAPTRYMRANVDGTLAVMEACRRASVRKLVYAASSSCYGIAEQLPTSEGAKISPEYPYALSKYLGEGIALHWAKVYGLGVISIRMFNVYGPRSRTTGAYGAVFGVFLAQKLNGKPLTVVGDGTQSRDFVYVTDVAKAFLKAAESPLSGEVFNLGAGRPQSVNQLAAVIGGDVTYVAKRPGEPDCTWADISKIRAVLGWEPEISFVDGVQSILDAIDDWRDAPVWTPETIKEATRDWFKYLAR